MIKSVDLTEEEIEYILQSLALLNNIQSTETSRLYTRISNNRLKLHEYPETECKKALNRRDEQKDFIMDIITKLAPEEDLYTLEQTYSGREQLREYCAPHDAYTGYPVGYVIA